MHVTTSVHFSSATGEWATPQDFYDRLDAEFHFVLDPCATADNAKAAQYFTKEDDGLLQSWRCGGAVFMNPPYGREISRWVCKAYQESMRGVTVVCLLPSRTDTSWWHTYCMRGEIRFIRGRLKFGGHSNSAPFPSAVVIFRGKHDDV